MVKRYESYRPSPGSRPARAFKDALRASHRSDRPPATVRFLRRDPLIVEREELIQIIAVLVQGGATLARVEQHLRTLGVEPDEIRAAMLEFEQRAQRIRTLRNPPGLVNPTTTRTTWYAGPRQDDRFWPAFVEELRERERWPETAIDSLDRASSKIVGLLAPPGASEIRTRGLAIGYVQSGKTSNFTATIAKAADAGYRLFVVLSGVHNSLRRQTQLRLETQLVRPTERNWLLLTDAEGDFGSPGNVNAILADPDRRCLCVVKKNATRLRNLLRWLNGAHRDVLVTCPILIIDDEADQASLNTGEDPARRTAINRALVTLLTRPPKIAYVGYTATPFANLFVDPAIPEDLYPRDFIIDLERPEGYFGPESIFGREQYIHGRDEGEQDGLNMVRHVPDDEVARLRPPGGHGDRAGFEPEVTPAVASAIRYFVLATAARRVRRRGTPHSTMLVHTTMLTEIHELFRAPITRVLAELRAAVAAGDVRVLDELRTYWDAEQAAIPPTQLGEVAVSFDQLREFLVPVLDDARVVVDNYRSQERLDYTMGPVTAVVIGGNTLSRGLTLEGLVVSFFLRTASAYDTLLQMGRWFGYRPGYADLPRIWMTAELERYFRMLATVEREIRVDVERYELENITPLDFAVRVRTHPELAITSALKMQRAVDCSVSYSARRIQTILFKHRDDRWLGQNLRAARNLVGTLLEAGMRPRGGPAGVSIFEGVPARAVIRFLDDYEFHENSYDLRRDLIKGYIEAQNQYGELVQWNIAVMGQAAATDLGTLDLGLQEAIPLINRSRMQRGTEYADIKALMSKADRVIDLDIPQERARSMSDGQLQVARPTGMGLLLLYPIGKDSRPMVRSREREPLAAAQHVIGVGLVFPKATRDETPQRYRSVDLSAVEREEIDIDPEAADAVDTEGGGGAAT